MSFVNKLKKYVEENPEEVDAYFDRYGEKRKILEKRFEYFEEWLETHDFDRYLYLLILKHNDEYIKNCYDNGIEPHPNNLLQFLFSYVEHKCKTVKVKELDNLFANSIWEFNDYYFQITWGQGCIHEIYNKKDLDLLLQL